MIFFKFLLAYLIAVLVIWLFMHSSSRLSRREEELMIKNDLED